MGTGPEGPQPGMEETHRGFLGEVRCVWTFAGWLTFQAEEIAETQVQVWKVGLIRQREHDLEYTECLLEEGECLPDSDPGGPDAHLSPEAHLTLS